MKRLVDDKKQELLDNLLESVSVDNKGNMEVGKDLGVDGTLTINSATDLKTKDGTSIGGGTLYEPSIVKAEEGAIYIPANLIEKYDKGETLGVLLFGTQTPCLLLKDEQTATNALSIISYDSDNETLVYKIYPINKTDGKIDIATPITFSPLASTDFFTYLSAIEKKVGTKQSTLYRHTVTFSESGSGYTNRFTAYSEKNTPIDSIQDLITVFGNTKLMCVGTIEAGSNPCVGIDIGTTADTILFLGIAGVTQKISLWYSTAPDSTLTITDNVTAM